MKPTVPLALRFAERVLASEACWVWTGARDRHGYGRISCQRGAVWRPRFAHRVSWELHRGQIPDGMCVLHRCDNTSCVNPGHLFLGTQRDNVQDMDNKGRRVVRVRTGAEHSMAKLSEADALAILRSTAKGVLLAREYGVTPALVSAIRKRKVWRHLCA